MPLAWKVQAGINHLGPYVPELSICICTCGHVHVEVLPQSSAEPGNWHRQEFCPSLARPPHLAAISTFFPLSGPTLETTLSSSWDMLGSSKNSHASWIVSCVSAAVPGAVPGLLASLHGDLLFHSTSACSDAHQVPGKRQQDRNPFPMRSDTVRRFVGRAGL